MIQSLWDCETTVASHQPFLFAPPDFTDSRKRAQLKLAAANTRSYAGD